MIIQWKKMRLVLFCVIINAIIPLFLLAGCGDKQKMSSYSFNEVSSVVFYSTGNMSFREKAACPLSKLAVKGQITDKDILNRVFSNMTRIAPSMAKYDPGLGVIKLADGSEIRMVTNSFEGTFYILSPKELKGVYKANSEAAKSLFTIQARRLAAE